MRYCDILETITPSNFKIWRSEVLHTLQEIKQNKNSEKVIQFSLGIINQCEYVKSQINNQDAHRLVNEIKNKYEQLIKERK